MFVSVAGRKVAFNPRLQPRSIDTFVQLSRRVGLHTIGGPAGLKRFLISATAGSGGSITPVGAVLVAKGSSRTFNIMPASGNIVANVSVDGISQGAITSYTFSNVQANHTIVALFAINVIQNPTFATGDWTDWVNVLGVPSQFIGASGAAPQYGQTAVIYGYNGAQYFAYCGFSGGGGIFYQTFAAVPQAKIGAFGFWALDDYSGASTPLTAVIYYSGGQTTTANFTAPPLVVEGWVYINLLPYLNSSYDGVTEIYVEGFYIAFDGFVLLKQL
jgi:hypothetical protein